MAGHGQDDLRQNIEGRFNRMDLFDVLVQAPPAP